MKKFIYIFIAATILSCTKSEVAYEPTHEIGFTAAAGNITKAVVDGTSYPTTLNMYVFSWSAGYGANKTEIEPDYFSNCEFAYKTVDGIDKPVWGGKDEQYCWPSSYNLHFAGYSKSGNIDSDNPGTPDIEGGHAEYDCTTDKLTITNYSPMWGDSSNPGGNDLMWFPSTESTEAAGYGKTTTSVPVNMYHTCAWLTFLVKGDQTTDGKYTLTALTLTDVDHTADVTCGPKSNDIVWENNDDKTHDNTNPTRHDILDKDTDTDDILLTTTAVDIETGEVYSVDANTYGNLIVIPQTPGKLELKYTTSSGKTDTVPNIDLKISDVAADNKWLPGRHYIYTLTIKANEIVIAPNPVTWTEGNWNVTVE